jgi:hypothetical protein
MNKNILIPVIYNTFKTQAKIRNGILLDVESMSTGELTWHKTLVKMGSPLRKQTGYQLLIEYPIGYWSPLDIKDFIITVALLQASLERRQQPISVFATRRELIVKACKESESNWLLEHYKTQFKFVRLFRLNDLLFEILGYQAYTKYKALPLQVKEELEHRIALINN